MCLTCVSHPYAHADVWALFESFANVRMTVFNVGLREWQRLYESGEKPSAYGIKKRFNGVKREMFLWSLNAPYAVTEAAFNDLASAFDGFFRRVKQGETPGYPKLKRHADSFALRNVRVLSDRVRLTGVGWVRLKERNYIPTSDTDLRFGTYSTVSRRADRWFISVLVYEDAPALNDMHDMVVGVDFGVKDIATCSNGKVFHNPRPLVESDRRRKRLERQLARRKNGGRNWHKTKRQLQRAHKRVADVRRHTQHQISHYLTKELRPSCIVLEDLNVSGMTKNHNLARAINDVGFYELRRQIEYKSEWCGIDVVIADRWFPSSKTCSNCGVVKEQLSLSDRTFVCDDCGFTIDRDLNAAINLAAYGLNR